MSAPEALHDSDFIDQRGWERPAAWHRVVTEYARRLNRDGPILDAGCNCGYVTAALGRRVDKLVVGLDIDATALHKAHVLLNYLGADATLIGADLSRDLPFPDASFATVVCSEVLEHLPDPERAVSEFARVLRPGGFVIVTTPSDADPHGVLAPGDRSLEALTAVERRHFHWHEMTPEQLRAIFERDPWTITDHVLFNIRGEGRLGGGALAPIYRAARAITPLARRLGRSQLLAARKG